MVDTDKIDKVFDKVDDAMVDALNKHTPSFEEIHVVLWRLNKKIEEQELQLYFKYFNEEGTDSINEVKIEPTEPQEEEHKCENCTKKDKEPDGSMYG